VYNWIMRLSSPLSRSRWAALGAAVAVSLAAGGGGWLARASVDSGNRNVLVAITPCRLFDTRPAPDNVGARNTPLTGNETATFQVTGTVGNCVIPADATTVVMNVTAIGASSGTFLTIWPADATQPLSSNLNPTNGAPPTPNLVTVKLSATGAIKIFNKAGTVDVLADVVGYFATHTHDDRYYTEPEIDTKVPANGQACTIAGLAGTITEGWDPLGNRNQKCFRKHVTTLAGDGNYGVTNGSVGSAQFALPHRIAVAPDGSIIVADRDNHQIRRITPSGIVSTIAGSGSAGTADGTGTSAQFGRPTGVAVAADGSIVVADTDNHRIRRISPTGVVTTVAGSGAGFLDANGTGALFTAPFGVAVAADGGIIVADAGNHRIRRIATNGDVTTIAGGSTFGFVDANGTAARFNLPSGVAVDADGSIVVADANNNRIRRISATGVVTTIAGNNTGFVDANGISARFSVPASVAIAADGSILVADTGNNRIRRIASNGDVTTIAGSTAGHVDATGTFAQFDGPNGIAIAADGTVIVADTANHRIRRID
jgi:sugar lactone lactonase YvrE